MYNKNFIFSFFIMFITSVCIFAQVDPGTANLTHSWTFDDGTARDTVAGADGILMGNAKILNGALLTATPYSWLDLPSDTIALNKYKALTVEVWFKSVKSGNPDYHMIASFGDTKNSIGVNYFFITPARGDDISRAAISCGDESTPWASETGANGTEYDDGKLHQIVSTIDSANITLHIDGLLQASTPLDTNNSIAKISSNYAYIAKSVYNADSTWKGEIPEVNIYNRALSPDEILFLYNKADFYVGDKPVTVEAESGKLGSYFTVLQSGDISYITTASNYTGQASPGDTSRIATYQVTFKDSGYYDLFVHLRVGAGGYDDDSFFYPRGFGEKNDTAGADWVFVNGLAGAGFSDSTDIVDGPGALGTQVWKWVNVSNNTYSGVPGDSFYVSKDSLTKTFQIASRENGLDIDKISFGKSNLYFSVEDLDKGLPGSTSLPKPDTVTGTIWQGPAFATGMSKFIGCSYGGTDPNFINYWTQLTPENAGKWGSVANFNRYCPMELEWSWMLLIIMQKVII